MLVIGLTGGIGSGKSTVADLFSKLGAPIIDTDQLARDVISPGEPALMEIEKKFGSSILLANHQLDRTALRKIIFNHPENRLWLEKLLHPLIRHKIKEELAKITFPYCIVVIPLLFETESNPLIQRILVIDSSENQQVTRTVLRDQSTAELVESIMATQVTREKRLSLADDIIDNNGRLEDLIPQVEKLHRDYLKLP